MNLKEQQYIVTLAGCGSMTQAAKKLNITQPLSLIHISEPTRRS